MGPLIFFLYAVITGCLAANPCIQKHTQGGQTPLCVCNATYCDFLDPITDNDISGTAYLLYETTQAGLRLHRTQGHRVNGGSAAKTTFTVEQATKYQEILGFGAALTDSAALNIMKLNKPTMNTLLRSYFGQGGSDYLFMRVPIAGSDFSETYYSYDDVKGDVELKHFSLSRNDIDYKNAIVKEASSMRGQQLKLFASPWSAPNWMKVYGTAKGFSHLNETYYQVWANYFVKYFQEFEKHGVKFWGVSPQNEPSQGDKAASFIPSVGWSTDQMKKFVGQNLGPTLQKAGFGGLKLMNLDDNRFLLPDFEDALMVDAAVKKYSSGVAVHWYSDGLQSVSKLTETHRKHPDQFLFYTEACVITAVTPAVIGSWTAIAERFMSSLFQAFNNWVVGWTEWNMVLNEKGGPMVFVGGYPASIMLSGSNNEFYKLSSYYVQAHFSSFVPPGSWRVQLDVAGSTSLLNIAFLTPQGRVIVVLANLSDQPVTAAIAEKGKAAHISVNIQKRSISTIVYK